VKVLDFGLAKHSRASDAEATLVRSAAGMMIGTLAYMSPGRRPPTISPRRSLPPDAASNRRQMPVHAFPRRQRRSRVVMH
jgi:serine/threonine protein kinase